MNLTGRRLSKRCQTQTSTYCVHDSVYMKFKNRQTNLCCEKPDKRFLLGWRQRQEAVGSRDAPQPDLDCGHVGLDVHTISSLSHAIKTSVLDCMYFKPQLKKKRERERERRHISWMKYAELVWILFWTKYLKRGIRDIIRKGQHWLILYKKLRNYVSHMLIVSQDILFMPMSVRIHAEGWNGMIFRLCFRITQEGLEGGVWVV